MTSKRRVRIRHPIEVGRYLSHSHCMVNPAIVVFAKSPINLTLTAGDPGRCHGWERTSAPPRFHEMSMAASQIAGKGVFVRLAPLPLEITGKAESSLLPHRVLEHATKAVQGQSAPTKNVGTNSALRVQGNS